MTISRIIENIRKLKEKTKGLYIYGAGFYGKDVYRILKRHDILVDGFLVTKEYKEKTVLDLPVYIAESRLNEEIGIVLGLSDIYAKEVIEYLHKNGVNDSNIVDGGVFITKEGNRENLRNFKTLEIAPAIGCKVNCKYCPQSLLLKTYFKDNKNRKSVMTLEDFYILLEHTPEDCDILFAEMVEPFMNKDCIKMLKAACDAGRRVLLYTTLVGASEEDVRKTIELPVDYVTLHVADKSGNANIPLNEEYYRKVELFINAKKADGTPFVDFVNAQAEPDDRVAELCKGKYEIMTSLMDRAGNLDDGNLEKLDKEFEKSDKLMCCFCGKKLTNNVVLPDGTVLLCNMDYGMQHVLGNLLENDYETVRKSGELEKIFEGMDGNTEVDILCRKCLLARKKDNTNS